MKDSLNFDGDNSWSHESLVYYEGMEALEQLSELLTNCNAAIVYWPLPDEVDYSNAPLPEHIFQKTIVLPTDKEMDGFEWGEKCAKELEGKEVCILIPGREFDLHGTRRGHGLGWYDRFLSKVPSEWVRIGFTVTENIAKEPLEVKEHDEAMNWLVVFDRTANTWSAIECES